MAEEPEPTPSTPPTPPTPFQSTHRTPTPEEEARAFPQLSPEEQGQMREIEDAALLLLTQALAQAVKLMRDPLVLACLLRPEQREARHELAGHIGTLHMTIQHAQLIAHKRDAEIEAATKLAEASAQVAADLAEAQTQAAAEQALAEIQAAAEQTERNATNAADRKRATETKAKRARRHAQLEEDLEGELDAEEREEDDDASAYSNK